MWDAQQRRNLILFSASPSSSPPSPFGLLMCPSVMQSQLDLNNAKKKKKKKKKPNVHVEEGNEKIPPTLSATTTKLDIMMLLPLYPLPERFFFSFGIIKNFLFLAFFSHSSSGRDWEAEMMI